MPIPKIVIVGRPNVGKSSLLNLLARRRISIVDPTAGVTRDRVSALAELPPVERDGEPVPVELIDTGGYGIVDVADLSTQVQAQIQRGIAEADIVLFVIDAQAGVVALDRTVADVLRHSGLVKAGKPVIVVANKVDSEKHAADAYEAAALGFGDPVLLSVQTGHNKHELMEALHAAVAKLPERDEEGDEEGGRSARSFAAGGIREGGIAVAIVGKRNAGKSSMINALAGDQRVIVSEHEGTTRDSVDVRLVLPPTEGEARVGIEPTRVTLIDTAGVRRRKSVKEDIDYYSHHRSLRSVRRADGCLLLIDAAVPVSQVDRQLVGEILKHDRPTVIVVNKWDIAEQEYTQDQYVAYLDDALKGLSFAPIVFTSAINAEGVREALGMVSNLIEQSRHRVPTAKLNEAVETILQERGPSNKLGKRAKIYYATQVSTDPPTIVLSVNDPKLFDNNYLRFFDNRLRDVLPYSEVPIKLVVRARGRREEE